MYLMKFQFITFLGQIVWSETNQASPHNPPWRQPKQQESRISNYLHFASLHHTQLMSRCNNSMVGGL